MPFDDRRAVPRTARGCEPGCDCVGTGGHRHGRGGAGDARVAMNQEMAKIRAYITAERQDRLDVRPLRQDDPGAARAAPGSTGPSYLLLSLRAHMPDTSSQSPPWA